MDSPYILRSVNNKYLELNSFEVFFQDSADTSPTEDFPVYTHV